MLAAAAKQVTVTATNTTTKIPLNEVYVDSKSILNIETTTATTSSTELYFSDRDSTQN